jgi:hypothetical protein
MAIHALSGKPGGGKSMYSVKMIIDELAFGSRVIITNVPLLLPSLNVYLQKTYPNKTIDLHYRIRMLDEDMTQEFWTYRPVKEGYGWIRIPRLTKQDWSDGKKPSFKHVEDEGVMYVIDEMHNFFNARAWVETGRDVLFYLSQHRHLGDTVVWITQAIMNVDKQLRSVTQDYTYMRNLTKEKMGLFKLPSMFVRRTYGEPATGTNSAMETGTFRLDTSGLASCYSTTAGVGIHDKGNADKNERKKGLPWWGLAIAIPAIVFAIYFGVPKLVAHLFAPKLVKPLPVPSLPVREHVMRQSEPEQVTPPVTRAEVWAAETNRLVMTGYAVTPNVFKGEIMPGKKFVVYLSDGSRYRSGDGHLQFLCEEYCVVDGVTNRMQREVAGPVTPPVTAPSVPQPVQTAQNYGVDNSVPSVYIIPHHVNTMSHPQIKSALGGGGNYGGGYSGF